MTDNLVVFTINAEVYQELVELDSWVDKLIRSKPLSDEKHRVLILKIKALTQDLKCLLQEK